MIETDVLNGLTCTVAVRHTDPVIRDHTIHGTGILPGVSFLDLIHRILHAKGIDTDAVELRDILFKQAVAVNERFDAELEFRFAAEPVRHRITVRGTPLTPDGGRGASFDVLECHLVQGGPFPHHRIDLDALRARARRIADMADLYRKVRATGIVHGAFMRSSGTLYVADGELLAELDLSPSAAVHLEYFRLHPAYLDAATLLPTEFADDLIGVDTEPGDTRPYIPIYIESFRVRGGLDASSRVQVRPPRPVGLDADLTVCDLDFYDADGTRRMLVTGLTSKRVRASDAITSLVGGVTADTRGDRIPEPVTAQSEAPSGSALPDTVASADLIGRLIARRLGSGTDPIDPERGFYELGLDSAALLALARDLEHALGVQLYPTLLFEYNTVGMLAEHLAEISAIPHVPPPEPRGSQPVGDDLLLLEASWQEEDLVLRAPAHDVPRSLLLVGPAGEQTAASLGGHGHVVSTLVRYSEAFAEDADGFWLDPTSPEHWRRLANLLADRGEAPTHVLWTPVPGHDGPALLEAEFTALMYFSVAMMSRPGRSGIRLVYSAPAPAPGADGRALLRALGAMFRSLRQEFPGLRFTLLESGGRADAETTDTAAELVSGDDTEVRLLGGRRSVRRYREVEPSTVDERIIRDGGVYLITGGLGGVGMNFARHLAQQHHARLVLCGRSPLGPAQQLLLDELRRLGAEAFYRVAHVDRADEVRETVAAAMERFGALNGVIHAAGMLRDGMIAGKTDEDVRAVFAPKVDGTVNLDLATASIPLDFFVLCSSTSAAWGSLGQADYACANAFMDAYAAERELLVRANARHGRSLSIGWPAWRDGGMALPGERVDALRSMGLEPLDASAGVRILLTALAVRSPHVVALAGNRAQIAAAFADEGVSFQARPAAIEGAGATEGASTQTDQPTPVVEIAALTEPRERTGPGAAAIAVVGISGRFPMAADLDEFWENLRAGRDCISEIPADRWDHTALYSPRRGEPGRTYGRWGGFLDRIDAFDAPFFHISPNEAAAIDPQERLFLETVWHTFEDAGHAPSAWKGRVVGVYAGVMYSQYQLYGVRGSGERPGLIPSSFNASIANRVSYFFDLRGPSIALDTMCSSSLTAIHLACDAILRGECEAAIAGGVNLTVHPNKYILLGQSSFLSSDGRCRSFGAGGDGYVPGEGVGAVLLRPLADALRDGDRIQAVVRASSLNHGGRTAGFSVPNPQAQAALISDALHRSGIDPGTVGYLEAHGTGTALGDPVEIAGLEKAFADSGNEPGRVPIGSVKSNVGHLEAAAGIAAVAKTVLQMRHRELVPSLHADPLNPAIDWACSPFRVQGEAAPWRPTGGAHEPLRAGISSFGAGGANAHLVLEEHLDCGPAQQTPRPGDRLFVFSARTEERLRVVAQRFVDHLCRVTESARGMDANIEARLAGLLPGAPASALAPDEALSELGLDPSALAIFATRIAQEFGQPLPAGLVDAPSSLNEIAARLRALPGGVGVRAATDAASAEELDLDAVAFTLACGRDAMDERLAVVAPDDARLLDMLNAYLANGPWPHGVYRGSRRRAEPGEQALAGSSDLHRAARSWVIGGEVDFASIGGWSAPRRVSLPGYPFERIRCWITPAVHSAGDDEPRNQASPVPSHPLLGNAFRAPGGGCRYSARISLAALPWVADHVVAGDALLPATAMAEIVGAAGDQLGCGRIEELTLESPLALRSGADLELTLSVDPPDPAGHRFVAVLARPGDGSADQPWIRHASGVLAPDTDADLAPETDVGQWPPPGAEPVPVGELYDTLAQAGIAYGPAFRGLRKVWRCGGELYAEACLHVRPENASAGLNAYAVHPALFDAALHAIAFGDFLSASVPHVPFSWRGMVRHARLDPPSAVRVHIASAGRDAVNLRLTDEAGQTIVTVDTLALRPVSLPEPPALERIFELDWTSAAGGTALAHGIALIDPTGSGFGRVLAAAGAETREYQDVAEINDESSLVIVPCFTADGDGDRDLGGTGARHAVHRTLALVQGWLLDQNRTGAMVFLTCRATTVRSADRPADIEQAAVWGLVRCAQSEHPGRFVLVDIDEPRSAPAAGALLRALSGPGDEPQWAVRGTELFVPRLVPAASEMSAAGPTWPADGTVLVTGASGALGGVVARHLAAEHGVRRFLLASRQGPAAPQAAALEADLAALGARTMTIACDVSDRAAVRDLLAAVPVEHPLTGVVHIAGVLDDARIEDLTPDRINTTLKPKADAAWHLHELTREAGPRVFVLFSSAAGVLGGLGQGNYAAANACLDALAFHRKALGLPAVSLSWGLWEVGDGMADTLDAAATRRMEHAGMAPLRTVEALRLLDVAVCTDRAHLVPLRLDVNALRSRPVGAPPLPALLRALIPAAPRPADDRADRVAARGTAARSTDLMALVRREAAAVLGYASAEAIASDRPFAELGFDSLTAVEYRNRIEASTGLRLSATLIFDHPTPADLAAWISQQFGDSQHGSPALRLLAELDRLETGLVGDGAPQLAVRLRELADRLASETPAPAERSPQGGFDTATDDEVFAYLDGHLDHD